mgnify:CR=1 FL=1
MNPALRAAHLALVGKRVTLCVPWLHPLEQSLVFPSDLRFKSPVEQEAHVRRWLLERAGVRAHFGIVFYPARYDQASLTQVSLKSHTSLTYASHKPHTSLTQASHKPHTSLTQSHTKPLTQSLTQPMLSHTRHSNS